MKKSFCFLFTAILFNLFALQTQLEGQSNFGSIEGTVTDSQTGEILPFVNVLDVIEVVSYKVPLLLTDETTTGYIITSCRNINLPLRNTISIIPESAADIHIQPENINVKGTREKVSSYYIKSKENPILTTAAKAESTPEEVLTTINFYPNPVVDKLTIGFKTDMEALFIADLSGKILQRIDTFPSKQLSIDMSLYPSGTYFLRYLTIEGNEGSTKLILSH